MAHPWRDIDWNWRNYGRQEKVALALTAVGLFAMILGGIWSFRSSWSFWAFLTFWLGYGVALNLFLFFERANRKRRGVVPQYYGPGPGRPISIGTMQAILGGGFLLLAALLGLFIWIAR